MNDTHETQPATPQDNPPPRPSRRPNADSNFSLTYGLIALLALIYLYQMQLSPFEKFMFINRYANTGAVADGEYYRLFTSMFLHANLTHILFNGWALYLFGQAVEELFGVVRFILIYLLGGLAGSIISFIFMGEAGGSIGASGAVLALFGAIAAYYLKNRKIYGEAASQRLRSLAFIAILNLVIGFASYAPGSAVRIDNAAHIGGAIGGLILGYLISPNHEFRLGVSSSGEFRQQLVEANRNYRVWGAYTVGFALVLLGLLYIGLVMRT